MATVNVYVTDDLKARMREHALNWSQIASQAFEAALRTEEAERFERARVEDRGVTWTSNDKVVDRL